MLSTTLIVASHADESTGPVIAWSRVNIILSLPPLAIILVLDGTNVQCLKIMLPKSPCSIFIWHLSKSNPLTVRLARGKDVVGTPPAMFTLLLLIVGLVLGSERISRFEPAGIARFMD